MKNNIKGMSNKLKKKLNIYTHKHTYARVHVYMTIQYNKKVSYYLRLYAKKIHCNVNSLESMYLLTMQTYIHI